jgi:hypothetical protein
MTNDQDTAAIRTAVDNYLPVLRELPPAQLQLEAGTLAVQDPAAPGQLEAEALGPADSHAVFAHATRLARPVGSTHPRSMPRSSRGDEIPA